MAFDGQGAMGGAAQGASAGAVAGPWGAAIGGVAGGLMGGFMGGKKESEASKAAKEALAYYQSVGIPDVEAQRLVLEELKQQGILTPELEATITQGATELKDIQEDPTYLAAQKEALGNLSRIGQQGYTVEDAAAIAKINNEADTNLQGQRGAILNNAAARGMGGSGSELAAQLQASQAAASTASQRGTDLAAQAMKRKLEAISAAGTLGGQIGNQQYDKAANAAKAQDAINAFNTNNSQGVAARNIASKNTAAEKNLGEKQRVADTNVGINNQEQQYNKELLQKNFENQLNLAKAKAGARTGAGVAADASNAANAQANGNMMAGAAGLAKTGIQAYQQNSANNAAAEAKKKADYDAEVKSWS